MLPGLSFVRGKATALDWRSKFDAVINIESSHCYPSMERFLDGVYRALKPGGYLLYADHRSREHVDLLRRQLAGAGLTTLVEENINANVVRALELDDARKRALIKRKVPGMLRPVFHEFAGITGTRSCYGTLRDGDKVYLRFVLQE